MKAAKMRKVVEERIMKQREKDVEETTLQPMLNETENSSTARKIEKKRKDHFQSQNISVFECLYNDAERYNSKKQLYKLKVDEENLLKKGKNRHRNKVNVFSTFEDRLLRSL